MIRTERAGLDTQCQLLAVTAGTTLVVRRVNFPPDFCDTDIAKDGIAGRAILCYARGRPLRQPPQDSWSSGPHNDPYCTKVPRALAR